MGCSVVSVSKKQESGSQTIIKHISILYLSFDEMQKVSVYPSFGINLLKISPTLVALLNNLLLDLMHLQTLSLHP